MDIDKVMSRLNPLIIRVLESRCHGLLSKGLMVITIQGIRSGKVYKIPVGYQRQGSGIKVLVSKSARKQWWRNYRTTQPVTVRVRGSLLNGRAQLMDKNTDEFRSFVLKTFAAVPGLSKQFGIDRKTGLDVTEEEWLTIKEQAQGVLIVV